MPDTSSNRIARLGVCSWSLALDDAAATAQATRHDLNVSHVQLALDPVVDGGWTIDDVRTACAEHSLTLISGMAAPLGEDYTSPATIRATGGFTPDNTWQTNLARAPRLADIAAELGLPLVTMHAGAFVDEDGEPSPRMVDRLRTVAHIYAERGIAIAFETGHEPAPSTLAMLERIDEPTIGVNFDPANMLLYNSGDPVDALALLLPHVAQVHIKDALPPMRPGVWGTEVVVGTGAVDWPAFLQTLASAGRAIDLIAEREAGDNHLADLRRAIDLVELWVPGVAR